MKILRTCMRAPIRDLIVSRILDGTYSPGTRLLEMALASECNVSQAPVREAFRELEALGLVASQPYRGTRVLPIDDAALTEAYELRALLEERSAQLAVPMSAEALDELRELLAEMQEGFSQDHSDRYSDAVVAFHRRVVAASGNRIFLRTWDGMQWPVRARIAWQRLRQAGIDRRPYLEGHAQVLAALDRGEGAHAGQLLRELITRLLDQLAGAAASRKPLIAPRSVPTGGLSQPIRGRSRVAGEPGGDGSPRPARDRG